MSKKKKDFVLFPIVRLKIRLHPLGILGAICFSPSESSEPPGVACPKNRLTCFPNENDVLQAAPPQQKGPAWSEIEDSISSLGTCQSKMPRQMTLLFVASPSAESIPFTKYFPTQDPQHDYVDMTMAMMSQ